MRVRKKVEIPCWVNSIDNTLVERIWKLQPDKFARVHYYDNNRRTYYIWMETPRDKDDWGTDILWMNLYVRIDDVSFEEALSALKKDKMFQQVMLDVINYVVDMINASVCLAQEKSNEDFNGFKAKWLSENSLPDLLEDGWKEA